MVCFIKYNYCTADLFLTQTEFFGQTQLYKMKINKSNKTSVAGVNIFFTIPVYISNPRCDILRMCRAQEQP